MYCFIHRKTKSKDSPDGVNTDSLVLGSTFIIGGGQDLELYMVSQGILCNFKYGKPILDRVITPNVSIGDASRCALISMDSTLKSDLTVGPPIDIAVYKKDQKNIAYQKCLNTVMKIIQKFVINGQIKSYKYSS